MPTQAQLEQIIEVVSKVDLYLEDNTGNTATLIGNGTAGSPLRVNPAVLGGSASDSVFKPEAYGAVGNGTTDDSDAFIAMLAAMPSRGGWISLAPKTYFITKTITVTKPVSFIGQGRNHNEFSNGTTILKCNNPTLVMFNMVTPNFHFRYLSIENAHALPTAGSAIRVPGTPNGANQGYPTSFSLEGISIDNFYNLVDVVNAYQWSMRDCYFYGPASHGVVVRNAILPDGGDAVLDNCHFYPRLRNARAAIYQESSGGLRILNCKTNGHPAPNNGSYKFEYGYEANLTASTVILIITGSSFENFSKSGIRFRKQSGVDFWNIAITGCQFAPYVETGFAHIDIDDSQAVIISGNTFDGRYNANSKPISVTNSEGVSLFNVYNGYNDPTPVLTGSTNVLDLNNLQSVTPQPGGYVHESTFTAPNGTLLSAYTPETGSPWTVELGTLTITDNKVGGSSSENNQATINFGVANCIVNYTATKALATETAQLVVRRSSSTTFLTANITQNVSYLYAIIDNVYTELAQGPVGVNDTAEHVYQLTLNGSNATLKIDGVTAVTTNAIPSELLTGTVGGFNLIHQATCNSFRVSAL